MWHVFWADELATRNLCIAPVVRIDRQLERADTGVSHSFELNRAERLEPEPGVCELGDRLRYEDLPWLCHRFEPTGEEHRIASEVVGEFRFADDPGRGGADRHPNPQPEPGSQSLIEVFHRTDDFDGSSTGSTA